MCQLNYYLYLIQINTFFCTQLVRNQRKKVRINNTTSNYIIHLSKLPTNENAEIPL